MVALLGALLSAAGLLSGVGLLTADLVDVLLCLVVVVSADEVGLAGVVLAVLAAGVVLTGVALAEGAGLAGVDCVGILTLLPTPGVFWISHIPSAKPLMRTPLPYFSLFPT